MASEVLAERAKAEGVCILTVGLGAAADRGLLETLAAETGGAFLAVKSASQLLPTYVDWLRAVGGYQIARDTEQVRTVEGDADLKVLCALPRARVAALERDGFSLELDVAGFESWTDGGRLHVWQAGRPTKGPIASASSPIEVRRTTSCSCARRSAGTCG
jgi:hypothetical protein